MALAKKRVGQAPAATEIRNVSRVSSVGAGALGLARVVAFDDDGATIEVAGRKSTASIDPSLDRSVLETAIKTGERVVIETSDDVATVVGALRTRATPGVDRADAFDIDADRIALRGRHVEVSAEEELVLSSKTARFVLRAAGEIESFAERIVSRASGVHKIVGRMLRLN
jgi:hypothetical protein